MLWVPARGGMPGPWRAASSTLGRVEVAARWAEAPAFPPAEPPSPADAAALRAYEWAAATALPGLSDVRRVREPATAFTTYHWAVVFHGEYGLADLVRRVQEAVNGSTAGPALEPVAVERVCVPLVRVGEEGLDLAELEWAGRQRCAEGAPLRLALGPATLGPGSVRLSVAPWDGLLALRHAMRVATRSVVGPRPWLRELTPYRPHASVAHARGDVAASELLPALERLRGLPPVRLRVRRVCLVRVTRLGAATDWHDVASVPLGPVRSF